MMLLGEWLYAGPFVEDATADYRDNYSVCLENHLAAWERVIAHADALVPEEGAPLEVEGQEVSWQYKRLKPGETKMAWVYYCAQHAQMVSTHAFTRLVVEQAGTYRCLLLLKGGAQLRVNGEVVFESRDFVKNEECSLDVGLNKGVNEILLVMANVAVNFCENAFVFKVSGLKAEVMLPLLMEREERMKLQDEFDRFELAHSLVSHGEKVSVEWRRPVESRGEFIVTLWHHVRRTRAREISSRALPLAGPLRKLTLLEASGLPWGGDYEVAIDYKLKNGCIVSGCRLGFFYLRPLENRSDADIASHPVGRFLSGVAALPLEEIPFWPVPVYRELARLELGMTPDLGVIQRTISFIEERYDCADFALHGILRIYIKHRQHLPEAMVADMERCMTGFKYRDEDPGRSMMYTRSENHRILFFSLEHLVGKLFPEVRFAASNGYGKVHAREGEQKALRWIKEKGSYGFQEWHSNCYYEEDVLALLSLYDFADGESPLRDLSGNLLELICAIFATHSYQGIFATTHGRSYEPGVLHPELEKVRSLLHLLFGVPERLYHPLSMGATALCSSSYRPDPGWGKIATSSEPLLSRSRMGLFPTVESGGVNCSTYRTAHYLVSGLVESMAGRPFYQAQAGRILLSGEVPVFVTAFESRTPGALPSYWGGQYRMPRTVTHRNVLIYIYHLDSPHGATHCYFPIRDFDQVERKGAWLFGRKKDAYIALHSTEPYSVMTEGPYRDRELLCDHRGNIWILEAGSSGEWGDFESFMETFEDSRVVKNGLSATYDSPSSGKFEVGWSQAAKVNGRSLVEGGFPLIGNQYAYGVYGEGVIKVMPDQVERTLDFVEGRP